MVGRGNLRDLLRDESGAAMLETIIVINLLLVVAMIFIELGVAVNQWNLAARATQVGARLAAVSDPVDETLKAWTGLEYGKSGTPITVGYDRTCGGAEATCAGGTFSLSAIRRIVYGSDPGSPTPCDASPPTLGMCDVFPRITPQNVEIRYQFSGLGYTGRLDGPVPTISVTLTGLTLDLPLLGGLFGLNALQLPTFPATSVGEDLSTSYSVN